MGGQKTGGFLENPIYCSVRTPAILFRY